MKHTRLSAFVNLWKWFKLKWSIVDNQNKRKVAVRLFMSKLKKISVTISKV